MTDTNISRSHLLPFTIKMLSASALLQLVILLNGNQIGIAAWVVFIATDAFMVWFNVTQAQALSQIRFGSLVAHAAAYVAVNAGFAVHAATLAITNNDALRGDADMPIDAAWFGFGMLMPAIWGVWFCFHAVTSIRARGFEDLR
ncbi:MAG TPA: hypothetical protein PKB03_10030 [Baekduia sp.]|nr:hypothetical protein [Baekduia sp.]